MRLPEQYADWDHIEFFVPGKPQPQGSKTKTRWGGMREDNVEVGPWRERVALVAHEVMKTKGMLVDVPVVMGIEFVMYRPSSAPKRWTPPALKKPDQDKCIRAIGDALTGIVYRDDSQITTHMVHKRLAELGEEMGARIWVAVDLSCYVGEQEPMTLSGDGARKATG